ncbi:hypothetical protein [Paenibacillus maysiensis]|uniref:hypothetical protein n=1 Tax=Paenibacillus maysiensis TaxID=1155954 RepID=UPI0004BA5914|nr:hypothetical protein [Paenibacillus maysiensis]
MEYDRHAPIDWANLFFKLAHYCHLDKHQVWDLTLPQLGYYLEQCHDHIEFTIKVSSMSAGGLWSGTGGTDRPDIRRTGRKQVREDGSYMGDYKIADEEDMAFLANMLG